MRFFLILIAGLLLTACSCKSPEVCCYYSNGDRITDRPQLLMLKRKLEMLCRENGIKERDLRVYTSLHSGVNEQLEKTLAQLQDSIYPLIKWENQEEKALIDSLKKLNQMLSVGVVAIDNRTGRILVHYSNRSNQKTDNVTYKRDIGSLNKTFLFALAMQMEFDPMSDYPKMMENESGRLLRDTSFHRPFKYCFGATFGEIPHGLERRYKEPMANWFAEKLELHSTGINRGVFLFDLHTSLTDLTKTWAMFGHNGELHQPTVIDSITDSKGKLLYRRSIISKQVLDQKTADEIIDLLDFYVERGKGIPVRRLYPGTPPFFGNFGSFSPHNGSGYFMAITYDCTVGVFCSLPIRNLRVRPSNPKTKCLMTVPFWMKTIDAIPDPNGRRWFFHYSKENPREEPENKLFREIMQNSGQGGRDFSKPHTEPPNFIMLRD